MPIQKRPVVSLKSIAAETNLSVATVSRILRGTDECSADTRTRVTEVARRLRYRPNLLVQGIQQGRTGTVGVIAHIFDEFLAEMATGIHEGLICADTVPIILRSGGPDCVEKRTDELSQLHRLIDRRVDGIILHPHQDSVTDQYLQEVWDRGIPMVTVDRELLATHADFVGTDDDAGARLAVEHLLQLGHRRIAHVAGPLGVTTAHLRQRSFEQALSAVGLSGRFVVDESFGGHVADDVIAPLLSGEDRPTAIFCANDLQAAAVVTAAARRGLSVPGDLSVVGFANLSIAERLNPPLTTIQQRPQEMGRQAAALLVDRITGQARPDVPRRVRLKPQLVVRQSTAAPKHLS